MSNPSALSNPIKGLGTEATARLAPPELAALDAGRGIATPFDGRPLAADPGGERARSQASAGGASAAPPPSSPSFPALAPGVASAAFVAQRIAQDTAGEAIFSIEDRPAGLAESWRAPRFSEASARAYLRGGFPGRGVAASDSALDFFGSPGIDIEA